MPERGSDREEAILRMLVGSGVPDAGTGAPGACLTEDTLAAVLSDSLLPEERAAVDAHLAACASCRGVVADLAPAQDRAHTAEVLAPAKGPRRSRLRLALAGTLGAAAAVLVVALLVPARQGEEADTDARLAALGEHLAETRPDLFDGFTPLGPEERRAPQRVEMRGGIVLLHPTGRTLATRPLFRWEPVPGTRTYEVSLLAIDGTPIWQTETKTTLLGLPAEHLPLAEGEAYLWRVEAMGPLGRAEGGARFEVAARSERRAHADAREAIEQEAPAHIAALAKAHFAIRHGYLEEAERWAGQGVHARPDDRVARETLDYVLASLGTSTASRALFISAHGTTSSSHDPAGRAVAWYNLACTYSLQSRLDAAFAALASSFAAGSPDLGSALRAFAKVDPDLENMRADPRWAELVGANGGEGSEEDNWNPLGG